MPKRPDLGGALRGREAIYGAAPAADPGPASALPPAAAALAPRGGRPKKDGPTWEDLHQRATFHLPVELHEAVRREAVRSGRTKSRVVADAIRQHLGLER